MKRRVVVTGLGIVSCIGNELDTVAHALRHSCSGIRHMPEYAALGLASQVAGIPDLVGEAAIPRKLRRYMADAGVYAWHAMRKAIDDAGIRPDEIRDPRTALIVGSGVGSPYRHDEALAIFRQRGLEKLPPYYVPQVMGSTTSGTLVQAFGVGGPSYSVTAACASSAHCIGNGYQMVRHGIVDRAFVGGAEEVCWTSAVLFDAMGALSTRRNDDPGTASRPFDRDRDGFVIAGGAAVLLLEAEQFARRRGARVYGEIAGYGAASDSADMVQPNADGVARAMRAALAEAGGLSVDYINPHATSTPSGDAAELDAIRAVFGESIPVLSATKGLTGHSIGAISAQEAIFCLLMMRDGFVAASANLKAPDDGYDALPIARRTTVQPIDTALSSSIGFGGSNAVLIFRKV
ncbi:beta-ketoacyl synthase N-terminal-like domain-containing protein [Accumulibacter sp.]|uniref:beta-ketoacyl synthase N-terminal-like domain-containing protein n=1 Tax=Accumulibacter sp. TaxID=2053492 RepID=UPI0025D70062|nr:beta-ketoacyl synthase N-terminal-like domain-containing protein [Accumulibacter sp.]MCM8614107.1 beta-ketoacyl-ACP synthase I [Accumulibacter sp.]MCM8637869.1 beta-ketoacyl-ACP synthase I [Accumulibacter sp.]MCM8641276.1 beta-ketoacyl-ACP synthase I [Accumulibacter sp.]